MSRVAASFLLLSLAACHSVPDYVIAPGETTVPVRFLGPGHPTICVEGTVHRLPLETSEGQSLTQLAAGQRVQISSYQHYNSGQLTASCRASLSLTPEAGRPLIVNSGLNGNGCYIEAVREDDSTPTGVAIDPTVGPPRC